MTLRAYEDTQHIGVTKLNCQELQYNCSETAQ
jgi:hypothetical protein